MPITIPDATKIRPTDLKQDGQGYRYAIADGALAVGAVKISSAAAANGSPMVVNCAATGDHLSYYGFNLMAKADGQAAEIVRGCIVEGFLGCTVGSPVYLATDGTLTHTAPTDSISETGAGETGAVAIPRRRIGVAVRTTAIYFDA